MELQSKTNNKTFKGATNYEIIEKKFYDNKTHYWCKVHYGNRTQDDILIDKDIFQLQKDINETDIS